MEENKILAVEPTEELDLPVEPTNLPASNVLSFILENGDVIVVRPSGTEPKVKFYYLLSGEDRAVVEANLAAYRAQIDALTK